MKEPVQKLLTVKEVSEILRLSLTETYRLIQSRAIVHFRVGPGRGAIRIYEKDVSLFLDQRRVGQPVKIEKPIVRDQSLRHMRKSNR